MPSYIFIGDNKTFGCFQLISNGFQYFKIDRFQKNKRIL